MKKLLCPSLMNLSIDALPDEIKRLEAAGVDIYHVDIMDGSFVPNFGMSPREIEYLRAHTDKLIDVHLMVQNPIRYLDYFAQLGCDIIYVHLEADPMVTVTLQEIRKRGKKAGLVINPGTALALVQPLLSLVDYLMVMTVNPGFCGQPYLAYIEPKIDDLLQMRADCPYHFDIVVDGGVDTEVLTRLSQKGVEGFVLGNLILFQQGKEYSDIVQSIRALQ